jgi:hypothetical protein
MKRRFISGLKSLSISRRHTLIATGLLVLILIPTCAFAIFGFGDIVFDPSNYAEAVAELSEDIQILQQAIQTHDLLQSELRMISSPLANDCDYSRFHRRPRPRLGSRPRRAGHRDSRRWRLGPTR